MITLKFTLFQSFDAILIDKSSFEQNMSYFAILIGALFMNKNDGESIRNKLQYRRLHLIFFLHNYINSILWHLTSILYQPMLVQTRHRYTGILVEDEGRLPIGSKWKNITKLVLEKVWYSSKISLSQWIGTTKTSSKLYKSMTFKILIKEIALLF